MDSTVILTLTHLVAFAAGGVTFRWLTVRNFRARRVDGHTVLEVRPHNHAE